MLTPATTEKRELFLQVDAPPPSKNPTYRSCFSQTIVCKFQIELERGGEGGWNHEARDQLPSQSHLKHVLCRNTRIHISASGI